MVPTNVLLPILALLAGICSLFTDVDKRYGKLSAGIFISILVAVCGLQIQEHRESNKASEWQKEQIGNLSLTLKNFESKTDNSLDDIKNQLASFGSTEENPTIKSVQQSIDANIARAELVANTDSSGRGEVTVQYFPKNVDEAIVEQSLRELGFNFKTGEAGIPNVPTNAIFFGENIAIEDVKLVALTLIRAGVEIKHIRGFRDSRGRSSVIQVGSGTAYINRPSLTVEMIQKATDFPG